MAEKEKNAIKIKVLSKDPENEESKEPVRPNNPAIDDNTGPIEEVKIIFFYIYF